MENFILLPIQSTLISILLLFRCYELGKYLSKKLLIRDLYLMFYFRISILYHWLVFLLILLFP